MNPGATYPQAPQAPQMPLRRISPAMPGGFVPQVAPGQFLQPPQSGFSPRPATGFVQPTSNGAVVDRTPPSKAGPEEKLKKAGRLKNIAIAAGLVGAALMTHRLPAFKTSFKMFTSDWKDWLRMALGVSAINHINKALDWHPKPWQLAMQTVVALTVVANGFSKANLKGWRNFPLLLVFVPLLVEGTSKLNEFAQKKLDQKQSTLPRWIPKIGLSVTSTIIGILTLRKIMGMPSYQNLTGQADAAVGGRQVVGTEALACARCGGQHLICMAEIGDMAGSLSAWFKSHSHKEKAK